METYDVTPREATMKNPRIKNRMPNSNYERKKKTIQRRKKNVYA